MEQAMEGLHGQGRHATREDAPGLRSDVEPHHGAPHAPDVCEGQSARSQADSAPRAATLQVATEAAAQGPARHKRVHEPLAYPPTSRTNAVWAIPQRRQCAASRSPRVWTRLG